MGVPHEAPTAAEGPDWAPSTAPSPDDFERGVIALRPVMLALARRRRAVDAEDLVQDVIEKTIRARGTFRPGTNLKAWVLTIFNRTFLDRVRSATYRREVYGAKVEPSAEPADPPPWWMSIDVRVLEAAIAELPLDLQRVIDMRHRRHLKYQQIADELGILPRTVATRLYRARKRLRDILADKLRDEEVMP